MPNTETQVILGEEETRNTNDSSYALWRSARKRLLEMLLKVTGCNCAIVRRSGSRAQDLTLEAFAFGQTNHNFKVPESKTIRFWAGNVFETCFIQHYPQGSLESLSQGDMAVDRLSDQERDFLAAVHWRASFPIQVSDEIPRLAILLSFSTDRPSWLSRDRIMHAWLGGQSVVSEQFASAGHSKSQSSVVEAFRHTTVFPFIKSIDKSLGALLRILCSGRGLGWHRAWLLKRSQDQFVCNVCAGGLTYENWVGGAKSVNSNSGTLTDEIAFEVLDDTRLRDDMTTAFSGIQIPVAWFATPELHRNGGESWFTVPAEVDGRHLSDHLVLEAARKGLEFQPSSRYFWCRFSINGTEYAIVLSHWESDCLFATKPTIESGVLIALAAEIISANQGSLTKDDNSLDFTDSVAALISSVGIPPIRLEEFQRSRTRATMTKFESTEAFRQQIRERFLQSATISGEQ